MDSDLPFVYRGCHFMCAAVEQDGSLFEPRVLYKFGMPGQDEIPLPVDTAPYASAAEALRHAQQQAVRWVHDQTGNGQGQL